MSSRLDIRPITVSLFMESETNRRRDSCSRGVQMVFRIAFKFQVQRSNIVQISTIFHCKNQV
jgi:hypothetical protein